MIYANDDFFNIGYNTEVDKLPIKDNSINTKQTMKYKKMITTLIGLFIMFCFLNCTLIYTFMDLLKNI